MPLNITVPGSDLVRVLAAAEKAVSRKPTLAVLGNVLVEAKDGVVTVSATDTEIAVVGGLRPSTMSISNGSVTLPASTLLAMIRSLPPGEVVIAETDAGATLSGSGFRAKLQTLPVADFPSLAAVPDGGVAINRAWLRDAVLKTRFATKQEDTRAFMAGALFEAKTTHARIVATDGHRLAIADWPPAGDVPDAILPVKTLNALAAILDGDGSDVVYTRGENHLFFKAGENVIVSRLIDGKFAAYERVLPKTDDAATMELDRESLLAAARRAGLVADQTTRKVALGFAANALNVTTQSASIGDADETIAATYAGPTLQVGLNVSYLTDFLEAAGTEKIRIQPGKDERSQVLMSAVGGNVAYRYVIMPVVL